MNFLKGKTSNCSNPGSHECVLLCKYYMLMCVTLSQAQCWSAQTVWVPDDRLHSADELLSSTLTRVDGGRRCLVQMSLC